MKDLSCLGHEPVGSTATGAIVADPCTPGAGATDISGLERDQPNAYAPLPFLPRRPIYQPTPRNVRIALANEVRNPAARASLCGTGALLAEIPGSLFLLLRSLDHLDCAF
jgi:hypothetical protein